MRFKDFGASKETVSFSDDLVSVSTSSFKDSSQISYLMASNSAHLEPWKTTEVPTEIPENYFFTVKYKHIIVGQVVLWRFKEDPKSCSISYWIGLDYCGRGLATAAINLVTAHAFNDLKVVSIEAKIHLDNFPSIRVANKCGFKKLESLNNSQHPLSEAIEQGAYILNSK
jgi:RimJ/RimL family protein N-acetyltransferase